MLFFYPLDFTFVCPTEIRSYSEAYTSHTTRVLSHSRDKAVPNPDATTVTKKTKELLAPNSRERTAGTRRYTLSTETNARLLSPCARADDLAAIGAEVVGVSVDSKFTHLAWTQTKREDGGVGALAIPLVADITKEISLAYDVLAEPSDGLAGVALRGTYIIDPTGTLRAYTVHDEPLGRAVEETVRAVKGLQFADAHAGEGCPASHTTRVRIPLSRQSGAKP